MSILIQKQMSVVIFLYNCENTPQILDWECFYTRLFMQSANHMAIAKWIQSCRCRSGVCVYIKHQHEEKFILSDFDWDIIDGSRWAGFNFSETASLMGISSHKYLQFTQTDEKKRKNQSDLQIQDRKCFFGEKGQRRMARLV